MSTGARKRRALDMGGGAKSGRGDGYYQPGPTLQIGSVHFNAMYDGDTIEANEEAWRTEYSDTPPDDVLSFSRITSGGGGGHAHGMVPNRELYDLLPFEPVFVCTGSSMKHRQLRHGCFVMSSLNHMCITDGDVKLLKATERDKVLTRITEAEKREVLQRKYQVRFVGFSVGLMTNEGYQQGKKPHVACNAGGLMSVKADEPVESGQYVVVDYPLDNLEPCHKPRTNTCCPPQWLESAKAQGEDCGHLEDKVTMIVRALDPTRDFASMSQPCYHAGMGHCGSKFPPWVVGQCVRGCPRPGQTIDLRYSAEIRYPRYITLQSPPPIYMTTQGSAGTTGTTLHDLYAASVRKMQMQASGSDHHHHHVPNSDIAAVEMLPSVDCQDLVRYMIDKRANQREDEEDGEDKEDDIKGVDSEYKISPVDRLMGFIDDVFKITEEIEEDAIINELRTKLNEAITKATDITT